MFHFSCLLLGFHCLLNLTTISSSCWQAAQLRTKCVQLVLWLRCAAGVGQELKLTGRGKNGGLDTRPSLKRGGLDCVVRACIPI